MACICANLKPKYPDIYGVCLSGTADAPAVTFNIVGMKTCGAIIMVVTFVFITFNGAV